jgi:hypothetical protein
MVPVTATGMLAPDAGVAHLRAVADIDGDGVLEVIARNDGRLRVGTWDTGLGFSLREELRFYECGC